MKILTFVLSFLVANSLLGQITFEPTFINQCSNQVDRNPLWVISDSTKTDWYWPNNENLNATLPKPGTYKLYIDFDDIIDLTINENEIIKDTFFTKRLIHHYYKSPNPLSNYSDCDSIANGKISDYYFNGKIRKSGTFKNGNAIDTLFSYFVNGQISETLFPNNEDWVNIKYYKNGKMESIHDTQKRYEQIFYPTGQLKIEKNWSKKKQVTLKEFYPNGVLKRKQSPKKLEIYNYDNVVVEKMERKEILIFERLFKKKKHGSEKFYEYTWESFDRRGIITRQIIFDSDHFNMNPFPDSLQQIDDFLFEKIIFYFNGKEFKKIELQLENKQDFSRKLVVYRKEEKKWVREKSTSVSKVYELIDNYSN